MPAEEIVMTEEEKKLLLSLRENLQAFGALSPEERAKVLSMDLSPKGWSKRSVAPYYTARYAKWIQSTLDLMLEDKKKEDKKFYCKDFRLASKTLRAKIEQGWLYLIKHAPTQEERDKYEKLRYQVSIGKDGGAIRLHWKNELPMPVSIEKRGQHWREDFEDYLDSAKDNEKFSLVGVGLIEEDIEWIKEQLADLPDYHIVELNENVIKLFKAKIGEI